MARRDEAMRRQAQSDFDVYEVLCDATLPRCHALHYLQMATEKAARSMRLAAGASGAGTMSHIALVKALRLIANQAPNAPAALARGNRKQLQETVRSVLPLAEQVENLAPAVRCAGEENVEYPWLARNEWIAPADHPFAAFGKPEIARLVRLLRDILSAGDDILRTDARPSTCEP